MGNFNYLHIIDDSQPKVSKKALTYSKPFYNIKTGYLFNFEHLFKHFLSPTRRVFKIHNIFCTISSDF